MVRTAGRGRRRVLAEAVYGARSLLESLEPRVLLSVNVLQYRNDNQSTGLNPAEIQLTPVNVAVGSFGKIFTIAMDGQMYAQPLVDTGITIASGPNTVNGAAGVHDVVFVETEHDSIYAIDSNVNGTGAILWKRSFIDATATSTAPGTNIDNPLGAATMTTLPNGDVNSADISPEMGITSTPVISGNVMYVVVMTKETVGGVVHDVQRIHAINIADGTDTVTPYTIGDTTNGNTNNTQIYVYGNGDGAVVDPYNGTGKNVVQFNALRENQRSGLSLVGGKLYIAWASHGDNGPYHGWVVDWDVTNIAQNGWVIKGVFNTSPNGGLAGIWQGSGQLAFEPDGSAFYFVTGNGPSGHGNPTLNASGFPVDGDYYEAAVKVVADPTTSPTNQNVNGWGLMAADYFMPHNETSLDGSDLDFGSGAPLLLPNSMGITGHTQLMLVGGKQGALYLLDRNNMGKFDPNNDFVVDAVSDGAGHVVGPVDLGGLVSTPSLFNGVIYCVAGYSNVEKAFTISNTGALVATSQTAATFGYLPGSPSISANGTSSGIVWQTDRNLNLLHAYSAASLSTELWNSGQKAGGADNLGAVVKFANPTVANGEVFIGTTNSLVIYGLTPPANAVPVAPVLTATALSGTSINLTWTDSTTGPNWATGYAIEELINSVWTQITTAPAGATSLAIGGLALSTAYSFRIRGFNGYTQVNNGYSAYSNIANATTTNQTALLDFSSGFAASVPLLTYNGNAAINGTKAELTTTAATFEDGSVFSTTAVDITSFSTQFTFQLTAGAGTGDGFTFTVQRVAPTTIGANGGSLGYQGIATSVAVKFDLYSNAGEGVDSTGLYTNGAAPTVPATDLTPSGVDLHSGHVFQVNMTYTGGTLTVNIVDTQTGAQATQNYTIDIPTTIGGGTAYVGFTAGTGGALATMDILTWTVSPISALQAPAAPSGLGAVAASATSVNLTWTNNASNQSGFSLDRATDAAFTQNLVTQTLPAAPYTYTDTYTGLAPNGTYYYRIRATNAAGSSASSNTAIAYIPVAPPTPTGAQVTNVTASEIDLSWTDHAGLQADGYHILRAVNHGTFATIATLPALNATPPSLYTWSDTTVTGGNFYEYHIQAFNVSGYNDFTGTSATTPASPSALTTNVDIGGPLPAGSSSFSSGTYSVSGGGADIYAPPDQFQFYYNTLTGDGTLIARAVTQSNSNAGAKAGIMFRDSTNSGAVFVDLVVTPTNGIKWEWRTALNGTPGIVTVTGVAAPVWMKIVRAGNNFTAYYTTVVSPGTADWILIGATQNVPLGTTALVGLAVSSHAQGTLGTATFTNVAIQPALTAPAGNNTITIAATPASPGKVTLTLNAQAPYSTTMTNLGPLVVTGSTGNDQITLDLSSGIPPGPITIDAGGGTDTLIIKGSTGNDAISVSPGTIQIGTTTIVIANFESIVYTPNGGQDALTIVSATVNLQAAASLSLLSIDSGGKLAIGAGGNNTLTLANLDMGAEGSMEINDNDMIVSGETLPSLVNLIMAGQIHSNNASASNGLTGLAVEPGSNYITFNGTTLGAGTVTAGSDVIMYTYRGDANFDGKLDLRDYRLLDAGYVFGGLLTGYNWGDFLYAGVIGPADYAVIDANLHTQGAPLADQMIALHTSEFGESYATALAALLAPPPPPAPAAEPTPDPIPAVVTDPPAVSDTPAPAAASCPVVQVAVQLPAPPALTVALDGAGWWYGLHSPNGAANLLGNDATQNLVPGDDEGDALHHGKERQLVIVTYRKGHAG